MDQSPDHQSARARALINFARDQVGQATPARPAQAVRLPAPESFPGYRIVEVVHGGGQGVVYRAIQRSTGKDVALKILRDGALAGRREIARFERETEILSQLNHPNVVGILDAGASDEGRFLVMDFIDGEPLDEYVRRYDLGHERLLDVFATVCEAVNAAHVRGVIHRDLKPSNVKVDEQGTPFVLDFGAARHDWNTGPESLDVTVTGQFIGSLPWASPEQVTGGSEQADIRTDVYSLGVMLYQLLAGSFPYPVSGSFRAVIDTIVHAEPTRLRTLCPSLGDEVETIVLRCLHKIPDRRYQSAGELARDLRHYLAGEPIVAKRDSLWYVLTKTARRHWTIAVLAFAILLAIVFALSLGIVYRQKTNAEQRAEDAKRAADLGDFLTAMLNAVEGTSNPKNATIIEGLGFVDSYLNSKSFSSDQEATIRFKVGTVFKRFGEYSLAEPLLIRAVDLRSRELGMDAAATHEVRDQLAQLFVALNRLVAAEEIYRDILARVQRTQPHETGNIAWRKLYLAEILERTQRPDEADTLYREVLETFTKYPAEGYKDYFGAANNYLDFLVNQNRLADAEAIARSAVATLAAQLGEDAERTTGMKLNLARSLQALGRAKEAEPIYRFILEDHRHRWDDKRPFNLLINLNNLADTLKELHRLDEAISLFREAVAVAEADGRLNPQLVVVRRSLADALLQDGRTAEAEMECRTALDASVALLGDTDTQSMRCRVLLGDILISGDRAAEGEVLLTAATTALTRPKLPADHWEIRGRQVMAGWLLRRGDFEESETEFRRALDASVGTFTKKHWLTADIASDYAELLNAKGRGEEAANLLRESLTTLIDQVGTRHPLTCRAAKRWADVEGDDRSSVTAAEFQSVLDGCVVGESPPSDP